MAYVQGILQGKISEKQVALIERTMNEIGMTFVKEEIEKKSKEEASKFIEMLFERKKEVFKHRPSQGQVSMLKDYRVCPTINLAFTRELSGIPKKWLDAKEKLIEDLKMIDKALEEKQVKRFLGYVSFRYDFEIIADMLFDNGIIKQKEYHQLIWADSVDQFDIAQALYNKYGIEIIEDNKVVQKAVLNVTSLTAKKQVIINRIAKANAVIDDFTKNFDLSKLDKEDVGNFLERYNEEYHEWKSDRATDEQIKFIKELQKRIATQLSSSTIEVNEEGQEIKGERTYHVHNCAILSDEVIAMFSKKFASDYIKQMDKELGDKSLVMFEQEEEGVETIVEKRQHSKSSKLDDCDKDKLYDMCALLYACIGQELEEDTVNEVSANNLLPVVELIEFVAEVMGKCKATAENLSEICEDYFEVTFTKDVFGRGQINVYPI